MFPRPSLNLPCSWFQNFSCDTWNISHFQLHHYAKKGVWWVGVSELSSTWTICCVTFSWTAALTFCWLTSLQWTPWVSVLLVPLNKLISSTQECLLFPSCSTVAFASHGQSVLNSQSIRLASADGRTAIFTVTLGKAEWGSEDREHMESVASD